jgi:hypothetical protein
VLQEILSGQITLDTSLVSSLFSPEDHLPSTINMSNMPGSYSFSADGIFSDDPAGVGFCQFLEMFYLLMA